MSEWDAFPAANQDNEWDAFPAAPKVNTLSDIAKSGVSGLAKGAIGLVGLPSDLGKLAAQGINWASGGKFAEGLNALPDSSTIQRAIESKTGKFYEPQTTAGRLAENVGAFAPAVIGGPEALAAKAVTRVAAPAAALTAAQGATDNPYVQAGAAIAGSALAHKITAPSAVKTALTAEDLANAAKQNYADVHNLGVEIKGSSMKPIVDGIKTNLENTGKTERNAAPVFSALDSLDTSKPVTTRAFDNLRQELVSARQSIDGNVRFAASRAIDQLDHYLSNIPTGHVLKGNAQAASNLFNEARGNYAAQKRLEMIGGKLDLADLNAATSHSGQNIDNATRQAIKQLIRPDKYGKSIAQKSGFSSAEITQMQKIARGTSAGNLTRIGGNLLGGGLGLGGLAAAAYGAHEAGVPEGALLPLAGMALKKFGNRLTANQTAKLTNMTSARSPEGQAFTAFQSRLPQNQISSTQAALLTALLARPPSLLPYDQSANLSQP